MLVFDLVQNLQKGHSRGQKCKYFCSAGRECAKILRGATYCIRQTSTDIVGITTGSLTKHLQI